jgi:hypothetical protein
MVECKTNYELAGLKFLQSIDNPKLREYLKRSTTAKLEDVIGGNYCQIGRCKGDFATAKLEEVPNKEEFKKKDLNERRISSNFNSENVIQHTENENLFDRDFSISFGEIITQRNLDPKEAKALYNLWKEAKKGNAQAQIALTNFKTFGD